MYYAHVSTAAEWHDYEWSWSGSLLRAAAGRDDAEATAMRAAAHAHREAWLRGYDGVLGFVTLVLVPA